MSEHRGHGVHWAVRRAEGVETFRPIQTDKPNRLPRRLSCTERGQLAENWARVLLRRNPIKVWGTFGANAFAKARSNTEAKTNIQDSGCEEKRTETSEKIQSIFFVEYL